MSKVPADPLAFIQACVRQRQVFWTYHSKLRLTMRSIPRRVVLDAVESFEVIESYPDDEYLPSFLVYATYEGDAFHVLFATDIAAENVRVVTLYQPRPEEWLDDLRTRRT